jgi:hypothetical protein
MAASAPMPGAKERPTPRAEPFQSERRTASTQQGTASSGGRTILAILVAGVVRLRFDLSTALATPAVLQWNAGRAFISITARNVERPAG